MIKKTLEEVKTKIEKADSLKNDSKKELLGLVSILQSEVDQLSQKDSDQGQSVVSFTQAATHEATRKERNPRLFKLSLDGLAASVEGFENSHPRLVEVINSICNSLSSLGI